MKFFACLKDNNACLDCGFCSSHIACPGTGREVAVEGECVDCQLCYNACPHRAIKRVEDRKPRKNVKIKVNGEGHLVPQRITVKRALEMLGYRTSQLPKQGELFVPCNVGGCYACALLINGELKPACTTAVSDGMKVETSVETHIPLRRVSGYMPHPVGGVGTPWWVKRRGGYVEVACFTHGCNFRCPQCQNYSVTYDSVENPSTPLEAAQIITAYRRRFGVDRIAISGGEPTLNKPWLVSFFKELKALNPDGRLHLDTNASLLDKIYIDELVEAGITDIGPDLKALQVSTFTKVTGITNKELAKAYMENAWNATKYIVDEYYPEDVFIGVGIPYNRALISLEEIRKMGERLVAINDEVQVTLLNYFPTFRRWDIVEPSLEEMLKARKALMETGLKTVLAQVPGGHVGP